MFGFQIKKKKQDLTLLAMLRNLNYFDTQWQRNSEQFNYTIRAGFPAYKNLNLALESEICTLEDHVYV